MKLRYIIPVGIILLMVLLNVIARLSRGFSDFYVRRIFPVLSTPFVFISGLFPFSVGEVMIILLLLLIAIGIPALIVLLIVKKDKRRKTAGIAALTALWILAYICTTENLNCFIMYQCTPFSERYLNHREHTRSELIELYGILIDRSNELALQVPRDDDGRFYITCDVDREARAAMKRAAKEYPQLSGYYPKAKKIHSSYFMSQAGLSGIYFPFSMEANYNGDMVRTNLPDTLCHEYAHLKGIMQEDEANFIGFIAAVGSENAEFRYSGYLSALEYVHNQIYRREISEGYSLTDTISDEVRADWFRFLPDGYWEKNRKKEIISTDTVSTVSETALDTNIKMNGREEGTESYSHVVNLLLDYYFPSE
ncbi:MAG: DUF3810 domain-containing protein [Ruminococcus sp.]|nr:DUF3810 domain-containing protein [Ruminococcus sp.]